MRSKLERLRAQSPLFITAIEWWGHLSLRRGGGGFRRPAKQSGLLALARRLFGR
jgi:hypothetical protein